MWYTFTCLSVAILVGIILLAIMMFKDPSITNRRRKKLHPAPDVDGDLAVVSGKKSPPPAVMFDVSSDEILADLQAEGLVRSPTLVDYKHDDNNYGFLPAHAPLQTSFVGMDHHVAQEGDDHQQDGGSFEITCTGSKMMPHLHDYHQTHDHHTHHYHPDFVSACSQFPAAGINLNLHLDHNHSQFEPLLRLNHVHPILRSSHPHLHHLVNDVNEDNSSRGCITDLTQQSSQPQKLHQHQQPMSLISSTHRRLFHTLGRNPSPSSHNAGQRVSTIDRNSLFRDNHHEKGSIFLNESTPPRAMAIDDENHYF
jgi:hypothetical protein